MGQYSEILDRAVEIFYQHQYLEALRLIEEAVEMPEVDWVGLWLLISFSLVCGEPESALSVLGRFASENRNTKSLVRKDVVGSFMNLSWYCSIPQMLLNDIKIDEIKRAYPDWNYPFCFQAHSLFKQKQYQEAIKAARINLARDGKCAYCETIISQASIELDIDGPELMRPDADFDRLNNEELWIAAFNAETEGEQDASTLAYRKLITKFNHPDLVKYSLANSYLREKKWGEAIRAYEQVLDVFPRHLFAQHGLAFSLMIIGQRKEAMRIAEDMYRRAPGYWGLGGIYGANRFNRFLPWIAVKIFRTIGPNLRASLQTTQIIRWMLADRLTQQAK
jgi:tetratricopeptide (TPR) repeat protein